MKDRAGASMPVSMHKKGFALRNLQFHIFRSFHNFAFYSPFTSDDCSYYEDVHYRPVAARRIVAALSDETSNSMIVRRVNPGNVAAEMAFIRDNFARGRDHARP